ncbi:MULTISPECIES: DNA gyrase modulator [unclassified Brenneria]|uniref:PmbA/TldA family metallopeptidase n=1 Tax=unclassified Brenneria TaxID=2634434 RepID=UPI0029C5E16B|nr:MULTISPECIES: DNA gyrase modulator [unclassified Brenneria]MDX5630853.1 hypothetical protein [Brenneria sp. L3-3Z]MDX5697935.1 hypothetical protein [Brenneria sp. L4-2C]
MSKIKMFGKTELPHSPEELKQISEDILLHAKKLGATEATALVKENGGLSLKVRKQKIDTIKHHLNKQISISIFCKNKSGAAQTSDFSRSSIERTVESAFNIARFTSENDDFQLPAEEDLEHNPPALDLYHPWDISISDAVKLATRAESAALSQDPRITNTDGANFGSESSHFVLAMSNGFMGGYATSAHYLFCSALAEESGLKQMDGWLILPTNGGHAVKRVKSLTR